MQGSRSKLPYLVLAVSVLMSITVVLLLIFRHKDDGKPAPVPAVPASQAQPAKEPATASTKPSIPGLDQPTPTVPPKPAVDVTPSAASPADLVGRIGKALESGNLDAAIRMIGPDAITPAARDRLAALAAAGLHLRKLDPVQEVGELELDKLTRWALRIDGADPGRDRIFLDLRNDKGAWHVERVTLPPAPGETVPRALLVDSLGIADAFLQAALRQNFELAREFVDPTTVSDAKIAALCILFEEGSYHLRPVKPLRAMFQRGDTAGYLANVETADAGQGAQFAITMRQTAPNANWIVAEVNLDLLLADYARRFAGGDVYYTPLVKNPRGGDTLVLYFDFDADRLTERTSRQLEIVAMILRTDTRKKITISGHTDSLGTEEYNTKLSYRRAVTVKDFLVRCGVAENQVVALAKGPSQPRRPNLTESGEDNPQGRRANRRTEIYLDF